jgi:hypothetical protein
MSYTADVTGGKPIAVCSQSISGVNAINSLVALYNIHGRKRGAIILFCPGRHTRRVLYPDHINKPLYELFKNKKVQL